MDNEIKRLNAIINKLELTCRSLSQELEKERKENRRLSDDLDSANYTINSELKPRIKQEQKSYDSWVTSGGSDDCMKNAMNGNCGVDCNLFGSKRECVSCMSNEEIEKLIIEEFMKLS